MRKVVFAVVGILLAVAWGVVFLIGYVFGPLAFNPPEAKPRCIIDMFLYKDYIGFGLLLVSLLASVVTSFVAAARPSRARLTYVSYAITAVALVFQRLWNTVLRSRF